MINIWDYKDFNKVRITTKSGNVIDGVIVSMLSSEDLEDIIDNPEDTIDIENKDGIFGFGASEIAEIVSLD